MRKVVFGKIIYDSDYSSLVYQPTEELSSLTQEEINDLFDLEDLASSFEDELFVTPEGRFFIFGGGGMSSEVLQPLNIQKAAEWINGEIEKLKELVKSESNKKGLLDSHIKKNLERLRKQHPSLAPFLN